MASWQTAFLNSAGMMRSGKFLFPCQKSLKGSKIGEESQDNQDAFNKPVGTRRDKKIAGPVEKRSSEKKNDTLRALHEAHDLCLPQGFRPHLHVAHHNGTHQGENHHVKHPSFVEMYKKTEEDEEFRVTIQSGIEKSAEPGGSAGETSDSAVKGIHER